MSRDDFKPTRAELAGERDCCDLCGEELENGECVLMSCFRYEVSVGRGPGVADAPVPPAPSQHVIDLFDAMKRRLGAGS